MPRKSRPKPLELVSEWPDGPGDNIESEGMRALAARLREAIDGRSARAIEEITGVDHATVAKILNGQAWPDAMTIFLLEAGLKTDLWPEGLARGLAEARDNQH